MDRQPRGDQYIREKLPDYVLGLLDEEERRTIDAHLETCAECRAELSGYREIVGQLAYAVTPREPPAHLRSAVIAAASSAPDVALKPDRPGFSEWASRLFGVFQRPAVAAVALLLLVILLVANLVLFRQVQDLRAIAFAKPEVIELQPEASQPTAGGILLVQNRGINGILIVDGMQPLDEYKQYQLWLIRDGQRTSGGVFSVNDVGYGYLRLENPRPLTEYDAIGITVEPYGGSPGPTSPREMGAEL